jgi:NitT/TauT family transport system substrate-binding protein
MIIRITSSRHTAFYAPLLCTMAGGFLEKHGLEYVYGVLAPGETAAGLIREGKVDVMQTAPSTNWAKMERGETDFPLNFALINQRDGFFLVARDQTPFAWKDLEGRILLADHGSQPLTMLRYAATYNGVEWDRINVRNAGSVEEMTDAFRGGKGDYLHVQAPTPQILEERGMGWTAVSVGASMPPNAFSSLCAAREFFDSPMYQPFFDAFGEAKAWVQQASPDDIAGKLTAHFPDVTRAALTSAIAQYKKIGAWESGPGISRDLYEQSLTVFESTGRITKRHPYDQVCY